MKTLAAALLALAACAGTETKPTPAQNGATPLAQGDTPAAAQGTAQSAGNAQSAPAGGQRIEQIGPGASDTTRAAPPAPGKAGAVAEGKQGQTPAPPASQTASNKGTDVGTEPPLMPDAAFRATEPSPLPVQPSFEAPVPSTHKLGNGARALVVENHTLPLIAVDVTFLHGIDAEPIRKSGLAEFVAQTVDEGTKTRGAKEFAEQLENIAANLSAGAGRETMSVHLNCLTETLPQALDLLADLVQNPAFRPEDVERVRVLKLARLQQKQANPGELAGDEAAKILYGDKHPWGQPAGGTPETIGSISPDDLRAFHAAWWVPNNAVISVSGDVKTADILALLEQKLGAWKAKPLPKISLPPLPKLTARRIDGLDKQGTTQSQVWVVGRMFKASDPDALPMRIANLTLGGLFSSRLNMNLREEHGYSYGVFSSVNLARTTGSFSARGGIVAKNTVEAIAEYEKELERFGQGVTDAELASAKEAFIRGLPSSLETIDAVAGAMNALVSLRLPLDYYRTLPGRVGKVTKDDVARVSRKYLKPADWPIVVVGPIAGSKDQLEALKLGPVAIRPAGEPRRDVSAQK